MPDDNKEDKHVMSVRDGINGLYMEIILIILGIICLVVGLLGCVLPMLPGPPVAYAAMLLLHFTERVQFSTAQLLI